MEISRKIKTLGELAKISSQVKRREKKVVLCHGVFDLLHLGHIRHLNSAKKYGDCLVVTVTADEYVKRGPGRPVFTALLRAEALANLEIVDYVAVIEEPSAVSAIEAIKPHFYVKGPDYKEREADPTQKIFEEEEAVRKYGGEIVFTEDITFSSSELLNKYFNTYPKKTAEYLQKLSRTLKPSE
ncbi:MAG: cytidyltransferase, partial [Candidatus Dadabacteria bacterium]